MHAGMALRRLWIDVDGQVIARVRRDAGDDSCDRGRHNPVGWVELQ